MYGYQTNGTAGCTSGCFDNVAALDYGVQGGRLGNEVDGVWIMEGLTRQGVCLHTHISSKFERVHFNRQDTQYNDVLLSPQMSSHIRYVLPRIVLSIPLPVSSGVP